MLYTGDGVLSEANRTSRAAWPKRVYTGYSSELISLLVDPSEGGNWDMSCHYQGTPGVAPLNNCSVSCLVYICRSNGDTTASCDTGKDKCDCIESNKYVLSNSGTTCILLPPPTNCKVLNKIEPVLDVPQVDISWNGRNCYESGVKYRITVNKAGSNNGQPYVYESLHHYQQQIVLQLRADIVSEAYVYSTAATYSNADIPQCIALIYSQTNGQYKIEVEWEEGYKKETTDINKDASTGMIYTKIQ